MKKDKIIYSAKARKMSLLYTIIVCSLLCVTAAVSTFAWFQASAAAQVITESSTAEVTVSAPDVVKFYYFKGNGNPGSTEYTGYSKQNATFGNTTNIVLSDGTFSTDSGSHTTAISTFANAWGQIDIESSATTVGTASAANCFNFSKMRPGCYYSFCIDTGLSTSTLKLGFDWTNGTSKGITGDDVSPKRYFHTGSATTNYPINLLMAINGYCYNSNSNDGTTYIKDTVGLSSSLSLTDKINFTNVTAAGAKTAEYTLLNSATTSTDKYIYFSVFMGMSNKSDAMLYVTTESSKQYFKVDSTNGNYSMFDGLKSTLSTVAVS